MKLKSYFAGTVEAALGMARRELGADAMLVNSQRTSTEFRHLGEYEIVCAIEAGSAADNCEDKPVAAPAARGQHLDRLSLEVSELRQQMERMAATFSRSSAGMSNIANHPQLAKIFGELTEAEIDTNLAYEIVQRLGPKASVDSARTELGRVFSVDSAIGQPNTEPRVVAMIGPPGAGKTSALVKIAATFGIAARKPCHILALDPYRVASSEQLRSYAAILGIGFQVLETTTALAQALEELRSKELILIDTPGLSHGDLEGDYELAHFFSTSTIIDTHLVLPASMRPADMRRIIDDYDVFRPHKLLFTKLDETETLGSVVNQSFRTGKPVSFLSRGQRIPEDLEAADNAAITNLILKANYEDCAGAVTAA